MSEACSGQLQAHYCETCGSQVREIGGDLGFCKTTVSFLQLTGTELCFKGRKCLLLQLLHQPSFLVLSILYPAISPRQTSKGQKEKKKKTTNKNTLPPKHNNNKKQKSHQTKTHQGTTQSLPSWIVHCDILSHSFHLPLIQQKQHLLSFQR